MNVEMKLPKGVAILVAEDSLINRKLLELLFAKQNIDADFVENGLEVIEKLSKSDKYGLLLIDLEMPEMNGYETAEFIRTKIKSTLPIIAMSGHTNPAEKVRCLKLGMNNYISKPINMPALYEMMAGLIDGHAVQNNNSPTSAQHNDLVNFDLSYFRTLSGGRADFEAKIFQIFIEDVPLQLAEILEAINSHDYETAAKVVHKMQSTLIMLGVKKIQTIVANLEQQLLRKKLSDDYSNQLTQVEYTINAAVKELAEISAKN